MAVTSFAADPSVTAQENTVEITIENTDGSKVVQVFDLNDMERIETDQYGRIVISPFADFSEHTIKANSTMIYGGSGHSLNRDQKVTLKANFDKSISYECGYEGAGYKAVMKTGTGKSINTSKNMPADGKYTFYIKNNSSSSVTVKSGSISY
ncbi:MAG TPA: hypothetical protein DD738_03515 [Ruminiclostridium sp.]|nr:hypothetical protein [Ruminiclostridium sp.]